MPRKVRSLYDVLIKTNVQEDQCTYFLLWLLQKMPSSYLLEILNSSGLDIVSVADYFDFIVQYPLYNPENSKDRRVDAIIEFLENKFVILETKKFSNNFDKAQFLDEIKGAQKEFNKENIWALFLSGDKEIPAELAEIKKKLQGKIGFLSWKTILRFLNEKKESLTRDYEIIINEFLIFANHLKIGKEMDMTNDDFAKFLEAYPIVWKFEDIALERLNEYLDRLKEIIIIECEELVNVNKDEDVDKFPCIYQGFDIDDSHIDNNSGYLFVDLLYGRIGILLTGYQNIKEKNKFTGIWDKKYKSKYKDDSDLCAFTWDGENDLFKLISGTTGKIFNPTQLSTFDEAFYWGYSYHLDLNKLNQYLDEIPKAFKKLIDYFFE
jgi:hypothetical protein